jgi:hypothetical protein
MIIDDLILGKVYNDILDKVVKITSFNNIIEPAKNTTLLFIVNFLEKGNVDITFDHNEIKIQLNTKTKHISVKRKGFINKPLTTGFVADGIVRKNQGLDDYTVGDDSGFYIHDSCRVSSYTKSIHLFFEILVKHFKLVEYVY